MNMEDERFVRLQVESRKRILKVPGIVFRLSMSVLMILQQNESPRLMMLLELRGSIQNWDGEGDKHHL